MAVSYNKWAEFIEVEKEILNKLGGEVWQSWPPIDPGFLIKARKEQIRRKIKYEERVGQALKLAGVFPEYQFIFLNRRILDFCLPNQKIVIEIDDATHLDAETVEKDKKKDEFASRMGFKTLRLKHPYKDDELKDFVESIKTEFLSSGGILESLSSCVPKAKMIKIAKAKTYKSSITEHGIFLEELSRRMSVVHKGKKKKRSILKRYNKLSREKRPEFRKKILAELPNVPIRINPVVSREPLPKPMNTLIIRKRSGGRRIIDLDCEELDQSFMRAVSSE